MIFRCGASLAVVLAVAAAQTPEPVTDWIRHNAIPLKTVEAGSGFDDMKPLRAVVGDARIVALGEATHGTREFFQLNHRILQYLVEERGFTIFSIEANMPEAYALNEYVLNGTGDPAVLLKGLYFWTWNTEEVLTMIRWMREYNVDHPEHKVQFTGFDMQIPNVAAYIVYAFASKYDPLYAQHVAAGTKMAVNARAGAQGANLGLATGRLPVEPLRGHRVRFSGSIQTEGVTRPYAGLWMRVDGKQGQAPLAFDNMKSRPVTGTTAWKEYSVELEVAQDATGVSFGALLTGSGKAWFDAFRFEVDGKPVSYPELDLDFEGSPPKGFYLGGNGYLVRTDSQVFLNGNSSLRMDFVDDGTADALRAASDAASRWESIASYLSQRTEQYENTGASKGEIAWAIQNARVVAQAMQLRNGEQNRDRDMAANIEWILDHNPGEKIVLWAHNGHVRSTSSGSYEPMGVHLRRKYGDSLRVFGLTFNEGTFRAVDPSSDRTEHRVEAAPPGTLEAALASSGQPRFALNLRALPSDGEVGAWFRDPRKSRGIGVIYSAANAEQYFSPIVAPEAYDALLFVEKTTPSREVKSATKVVPVVVTDVKDEPGMREVRDDPHKVSLRLPSNWRFDGVSHWGDQETTMRFVDDASRETGSLYYKWYATPNAELADPASLKPRVDMKVKQRREQGRTDYRIDADKCESKKIGGRPALACVGNYTMPDRTKMSEYLVWVVSPRVNALFFGSSSADMFDDFQASFEFVAQSLKLPD